MLLNLIDLVEGGDLLGPSNADPFADLHGGDMIPVLPEDCNIVDCHRKAVDQALMPAMDKPPIGEALQGFSFIQINVGPGNPLPLRRREAVESFAAGVMTGIVRPVSGSVLSHAGQESFVVQQCGATREF